jgi:hypothetical protein
LEATIHAVEGWAVFCFLLLGLPKQRGQGQAPNEAEAAPGGPPPAARGLMMLQAAWAAAGALHGWQALCREGCPHHLEAKAAGADSAGTRQGLEALQCCLSIAVRPPTPVSNKSSASPKRWKKTAETMGCRWV